MTLILVDGLFKLNKLVKSPDRLIIMVSMVDSATFHKKIVTIIFLLQSFYGNFRHFGKTFGAGSEKLSLTYLTWLLPHYFVNTG